jgi:hypothetical protein
LFFRTVVEDPKINICDILQKELLLNGKHIYEPSDTTLSPESEMNTLKLYVQECIIDCIMKNNVENGRLMNPCDPLLLLVCILFRLNIKFEYVGVVEHYTISNPRGCLVYKCTASHFLFVRQESITI